MGSVTLAIAVFVVVYITITFELVNKAVAALLGVMVLVILRVVDEHHAVGFIDFETILLLMGMMIIVAILRKSGVFSLLTVKIAEMTRGNPLKILVLFSVVTAVLSAFLDNVTTVLIIIPIVVELTVGLGLNPKLFVISQAVISNIGGTATLIGDPPNIIIGSRVGLTFNQFVVNLIIPVTVSFAVALVIIWALNRRSFAAIDRNLAKLFSVELLLEKIRFQWARTPLDPVLLKKAGACLGLAIIFFTTQTITGLSPGIAAVTAATLLLAVSKVNVEHVLEEVEWSTLLFFAGLFILVGVLEEEGVIEWIATNIFLRLGDNPYIMVLTVLWVSGIASGFLDNIPFTITMVPVVQMMLAESPIPNDILWWALALGACFGGNLTMVGASANIVAVGSSKQSGVDISFLEFMKSSALITLITLTISSVYLVLFLRFSL
ncbi:MAG: ArsB/NhaD family transporter [Gemmatimonadetes bacterium]|nr:ArsB/NhaD family transporter [Gemmatimonadota bacterium]NNM05419.1 ArsB/NhaD family transporter [Gemmatimonadota bacterium]